MLVYGDRSERIGAAEQLRRIATIIDEAAASRASLDRHARLVSALIEAGRLQQGIADADFAAAGADAQTADAAAAGELVMLLASAVLRSWDSGFQGQPLPAVPSGLAGSGGELDLRLPEGFAFYALYPEAYIAAARRLKLEAPARVIGIRSIGTTLAAVVAATLDAPPPVTVRPFGNPYARQVSIAPQLERDLLRGDFHYLVVDEGPGASGSSFGAVADWLMARGVPLERIAFLPSHKGDPGGQASAAHRRRWRMAQRVPAEFGTELAKKLESWLPAPLRPLDGDIEEISGGEWRRLAYASESEWPAVVPMWERRKFLARAGGKRFLVKFAGLGLSAERKLTMARALHAAGLVPGPVGLVHGFLVERWVEEADHLDRADQPIAELARYIGARARLFPAKAADGASLGELLEMVRRNISLTLGDEAAARAIAPWERRIDVLARRVVPVRTDNRMDRHEWLRARGRLIKTDALDHHCAHDLIGCQDMAWDVAGAVSEFQLDRGPSDALISVVEDSSGRHVDAELLAFYRIAYSAFRLGQAVLGKQFSGGLNAAEEERLNACAKRHAAALQQLVLQEQSSATPLESPVG